MKFLDLWKLRNGFYTKFPKMNLIENLELVLVCDSNSVWNLNLHVKEKLQEILWGTFLLFTPTPKMICKGFTNLI